MPALDNITTTVPVGQLQSQDYTGNLMNYGMAGVDPFEFVKMVQTGEVTFDSTNPNQQALIDQYDQMARDANANNPNANLPSAAQAIGGAVVGIAGPLVANTFGQAYANTGGNFGEALSATVKSPLSGGKNLELKSTEAGTAFDNARFFGDDVRSGDIFIPNLNKLDTSNFTRTQMDAVEALRKSASSEGILKGGSVSENQANINTIICLLWRVLICQDKIC
jgi:hypothetical protein